MKKYKRVIKYILLGAILGFLLSFLKHNGYYIKIVNSFKSINIFLVLVIIVISFFVNIFMHELGHLLYFVFKKVKIRALYVLIFVLKRKENGKYKLKIYPENIKILGGMVVPIVPSISTDQEYSDFIDVFKKALIMGPIFSLIYLTLSITITTLLIFFGNNLIILGISQINTIVTAIVTGLVFLTSRIETEELCGDFVAAKRIKSDELFALAQVLQNKLFDKETNDQTSKYLYQKTTKYFNNNQYRNTSIDANALSNAITYYLSYKHDNSLDNIIERLSINSLKASVNVELAYLIAAYYYKNKNVFKAYEIFFSINIEINSKLSANELLNLKKEYEHLMNIADNSLYFKENKDAYLKTYFLFKPIVDLDEIYNDLFKKLPFIEYSCLLDMNS